MSKHTYQSSKHVEASLANILNDLVKNIWTGLFDREKRDCVLRTPSREWAKVRLRIVRGCRGRGVKRWHRQGTKAARQGTEAGDRGRGK